MFSPRPSLVALAAWVSVVTLRGASASRVQAEQTVALGAGCDFPCGAGSVVKDDITFEIGAEVNFAVQADQCLAACVVVKSAMLGLSHEGCEAVLPGSEKVSKSAGNKLCCMTRACTATTSTTTTTEKFKCEDGQGPAFASYRQTGDNSFDACAARCDAEDECKGFDFTEAFSAHPELISLTPTLQKKDSCRLYRTAKLRSSDGGTSRRQFCSKIGAAEEPDINVQYLTGSSAVGCNHPCGAKSVSVEGMDFSIGFGAGIEYQVSPDMCLGNCAAVQAGTLLTASCSTVLPGSEKVSKAGNSKLCCVSDVCQSTTTTTSEPALNLQDKFPCKAGQGEAWQSYKKTDDNSFGGCAAVCNADEKCQAFDYTTDESQFPEIFSFNPTLAKKDACRLYTANKPRLGDTGMSQRQYCEKKATSTADEPADVFWPDIEPEPSSALRARRSSACQHACGATSLSIDGLDFEIGAGRGISYRSSPDTCLGTCIVAKPGIFSNPSCSSVLPGSAKVSKSKGLKLCCLSETCPSPTTTEPKVGLNQKFSCQAGQGEANKAFKETGDTSFEDCAAECDENDKCQAFDYTTEKSQHPEIFSSNPTMKSDSCRLFKANKARLKDAGFKHRQYCEKKDAKTKGVDDEDDTQPADTVDEVENSELSD